MNIPHFHPTEGEASKLVPRISQDFGKWNDFLFRAMEYEVEETVKKVLEDAEEWTNNREAKDSVIAKAIRCF